MSDGDVAMVDLSTDGADPAAAAAAVAIVAAAAAAAVVAAHAHKVEQLAKDAAEVFLPDPDAVRTEDHVFSNDTQHVRTLRVHHASSFVSRLTASRASIARARRPALLVFLRTTLPRSQRAYGAWCSYLMVLALRSHEECSAPCYVCNVVHACLASGYPMHKCSYMTAANIRCDEHAVMQTRFHSQLNMLLCRS
jgi:hypothetical protein